MADMTQRNVTTESELANVNKINIQNAHGCQISKLRERASRVLIKKEGLYALTLKEKRSLNRTRGWM